jgi:hypothetical protein
MAFTEECSVFRPLRQQGCGSPGTVDTAAATTGTSPRRGRGTVADGGTGAHLLQRLTQLFATALCALVSGCAWQALPPRFGMSKSTAHRRFLNWSRAGAKILHRLDDAGLLNCHEHPRRRPRPGRLCGKRFLRLTT